MDHPTTPFGRRTLTLAQVASQAKARACPADKPAHKWKVFRSITECRNRIGVSDRALAVLNALLTFLPETAMVPGPDLTVFPSNRRLAARAHGMAESTLRRQLQALVAAGLIIRRDSPNGKRYARRGGEGTVTVAYGFDLTPLVARAEEFERMAGEVEHARRQAALARERVSLLRRDIGKMLAAAAEAGITADWGPLRTRFEELCHRLPRLATAATLDPLTAGLQALAADLGKVLESHADAVDLNGSDGRSERHHQNSESEPTVSLEPAAEERPRSKPMPFSLGSVLKACPDIAMYDRHGITGWRDLVATAGKVRGMLGISPSAWEEARTSLGDADAAVTLAAILQRADQIRNPGGYLRALTARARLGRFSTGAMIMALMRRQVREGPTLPSAMPCVTQAMTTFALRNDANPCGIT
ncbi:plasmid replication protein RepC [Methylobacterium sp. JK268]